MSFEMIRFMDEIMSMKIVCDTFFEYLEKNRKEGILEFYLEPNEVIAMARAEILNRLPEYVNVKEFSVDNFKENFDIMLSKHVGKLIREEKE